MPLTIVQKKKIDDYYENGSENYVNGGRGRRYGPEQIARLLLLNEKEVCDYIESVNPTREQAANYTAHGSWDSALIETWKKSQERKNG